MKLTQYCKPAILQFKKKSPQLFKFCCSFKKDYPEVPEKDIKILLTFLTANLYEARFSYFSTKTAHHNRFNIEAYMRVQLVSVKVYTKDVCRGIEIVPPSQICLEEIVIFLKSMLFILTCNE